MSLSRQPLSISPDHQALRDRPRRIIFNNDGCDVFTVPLESEPTADNLLAERTRDLAGTQVDVISYTTISSGFSLFTHDTRVGEVLDRAPPAKRNNIAPALIRRGRDCLRIMVDFGHEHGMEVFWSMRMNDTHDGAHRPEKPYFLFPRLKQEHPEYLMGTPEARPRHGSWSAVDYGLPFIRELAFRFVEEVCQRYDVDGVELDFFRHPVFFRRVAAGEHAAAEDCAAMTELLRRIRNMTMAEGKRRGRPFLIAVRTPDSLPYARAIGLDVETWMAQQLIDIWVPGGYFRLQTRAESLAQAHPHGVKVWAGMSESRVGGGHHRDPGRASDACYRARALNAWEAGVDGVYLFNLFDPNRRVWRELGEPEMLRSKERTYFASVMGRKNAAGGNLPYDAYHQLADLTPDDPVPLREAEPYRTKLMLSGIATGTPTEKGTPDSATLRLVLNPPSVDPDTLDVLWNGIRLPTGTPGEGALSWSLNTSQLCNGENLLSVQRTAGTPASVLCDVCLEVIPVSPAYRLPERALPLDDSWDVIVVGGGPAGCAAATAAAREGARTLLLEATGILGGMGTAGLVPWFCGYSDGKQLIVHGLAQRVRKALCDGMPHLRQEMDANPLTSPSIDPELLKRIYDDMVTDAGVKVRFHSVLGAVETRAGGEVDALIVADKRGMRAYRANVYLDCTGDGDLAAWAGAPFEKGDPSGNLQPATHCFMISNIDEEVLARGPRIHAYDPESPVWKALRSQKYPSVPDPHACNRKIGPGVFGFNTGHVYDVDNTDPDSVTSGLFEGRRMAGQYRDAFAEYHPAFADAFLAATGSLLGIRETRRILGDYRLTLADYDARRSFPDEISRSAYNIDVHGSRKKTREEWANTAIETLKSRNRKITRSLQPGESFGVPYRSLIPRGLTNVLVAGRCLSGDRRVNGSLRIMACSLNTGEAAGIAAALCAAARVPVRSVDVSELQRRIRAYGGYLPAADTAAMDSKKGIA